MRGPPSLEKIRSFLSEARRRRVYVSTATYIAIAIVIIEIVGPISEALMLPDWTSRLVILLLGLGLPVVVTVAWTFDVTRKGPKRTPPANASARTDGHDMPDDPTGPAPANTAPADPPELRSVAVLPFENLSSSDEGAVFADGLHHDLLTRLSRVEELRVISRTSVLRYRDGKLSIPAIARELGVDTILEGGMQHVGDRVRLNVQLIDARRDQHRWAETYDRSISTENIFDIQSELAGKIVRSLRIALTPEERAEVNRQPTATLDTYLLYAQGRTHLAQRTRRDIGEAVGCFQRAIEKQSSYAPAWAALAEALELLEWYGYPSPEEAPDPMDVARQAVALDAELGEAYTSLGIVQAARQQGPAAIRSLIRAIELDPSDAEAQIWLGWLRMITGRPAEGVKPAERAAELDPRAPYTRVFLGQIYLANGAPEAAWDESKIARGLQPEYALSHLIEGLSLHHMGRFPEAVLSMEEALSLARPRGHPSLSEAQAVLAATHAASGDVPEARRLLADIRNAAAPFSAGLVHGALGEVDEAFEAFRGVRKWDAFSTPLIRYLFPELLDPLRNDPRFSALLRDVNQSWGLNPDGSFP